MGEEEREGILAFGDPGDRFHAERVDGPKESEEEGSENADLRISNFSVRMVKEGSEEAEKKEKEDSVGGMEGDIDGVEGSGVVDGGTEDGDIGHVRKPKKRHIHTGVRGIRSESSANGRGCEAGVDQAVPDDIGGIVKVH
ncbi:MAG: hypothetical protein J6Y19_03810 [Kiritimatiellae bacterium]|nr:hypothetical protein [Kiritimatiellia bacterium]